MELKEKFRAAKMKLSLNAKDKAGLFLLLAMGIEKKWQAAKMKLEFDVQEGQI